LSEGHVRVRSWIGFKELVEEKRPKSIVYVLEQNALSPNKELTSLRVILLHERKYYLFLDFAKDHSLRETGIPLTKDRNGLWNLEDEQVKAFLQKELGEAGLEIYSFWTT
jgi:hypothetical protein